MPGFQNAYWAGDTSAEGNLAVPRLSILIPVLGNLDRLEDTLVSVLENRPHDSQIVVALDQSYDDPYELTDELTFVQGSRELGVAECLNLGLAATEAPIVHVLRCGAEVEPNWAEPALEAFDDPDVASVAPLVLDRAERDRVLCAGVGYQSAGRFRRLAEGMSLAGAKIPRRELVGPEVWAAFYRRSAVWQAGGFSSEAGDRLVGVDMGLWLAQAGWQTVFEPQSRLFVDQAAVRRPGIFQEGWQSERFFWRWAPRAGWGRSLTAHTGLLASESLRTLIQPWSAFRLLGRLVGGLRLAAHHEHWQTMRDVAVRPGAPAEPHFADSTKAVQRETMGSVRL